MSVRVEDYSSRLLASFRQSGAMALRTVVDEIERESRPNTPKDKGDLRNNVVKSVLGLRAKIMWRQNYAIFQEEKQYSNYTTPGTGPHFAENAVRKVVERSNNILKRSLQ